MGLSCFRLDCRCLILSGLVWPLTGQASYFMELDADQYSESIPVHELRHHWRQGYRPGNQAFSHNRLEFGYREGHAEWGWILRYDYDARYSEDTAELIYREETDRRVPAGRDYHLQLQVNHNRSQGLFVGHRHQFFEGRFRFHVRAYFLFGQYLEQGRLTGSASVDQSDELAAQLNLNYRYSEDKLLDRQTGSPDGYGLASDLAFTWRPVSAIRMDLQIQDWFYHMLWDEAPLTEARASTDVVERDEDGFFNYRPLLSGVETNRSFTQTLDPSVRAQILARMNERVSWVARYRYRNSLEFPYLGLRWHAQAGDHELAYGWQTQSLAYAWLGERWQCRLEMDELIDRAYQLRIGLSLQFR